MSDHMQSDPLDHLDVLEIRRNKLHNLSGIKFPNNFKPNALADELKENFASYDQQALQNLSEEKKPEVWRIAGRIMLKRIMGKASFIHLQDRSGQIQIYVSKDKIGEEAYEEFKHWDIGDIIGVEGILFKTKTDELTINAVKVFLLTKSLRPLPEKFHGLNDQESRYRQRYVDLIVNEETRKIFKTRSKIISFVRSFLEQRHFLEVETPMMQVIPGGATARPFITHHHALDIDLYLRIAPELYLKRLVVGGFERVFEINRNFRNEGLSTRHNPEFTMVEFYQAYATYEDLIDLTEKLFCELALSITGSNTVQYQNYQLDFSKPFARMSLVKSISHFNPEIKPEQLKDIASIKKIFQEKNLGIPDIAGGLGRWQTELFETLVEDKLIQPTFITEYPTEVSPLARCNDKNPDITDRFEFFIAGREIANGFSELNDPEDQAARFKQQVEQKDSGNDEAMHYDDDYITALEYGLPPTAGEGIGIDRLVMLFTNAASIRDVILFPHMKPLHKKITDETVKEEE